MNFEEAAREGPCAVPDCRRPGRTSTLAMRTVRPVVSCGSGGVASGTASRIRDQGMNRPQ